LKVLAGVTERPEQLHDLLWMSPELSGSSPKPRAFRTSQTYMGVFPWSRHSVDFAATSILKSAGELAKRGERDGAAAKATLERLPQMDAIQNLVGRDANTGNSATASRTF
jgi:hypothetical protein